MNCAPTLIVGYGNPSRGDDALGPAANLALEALVASHPDWGQVDLVTDFQLQIEFVTDLLDRQRIIFIDASASGAAPFAFGPLEAKEDASVTTHALSPGALLTVYRRFHGGDPAPSFLLAIRGYDFELGAPLSAGAARNLDAAVAMLEQWLTQSTPVQAARAVRHA